ncbi:glycosyltransferase family 4 protein [Ligilactobacillus equi]|uniref:glycosyltransferase family 4 protein n=1 Tax=Ligilactobacillus equi TaxID=137357 RepID=UPI002ECFBC05
MVYEYANRFADDGFSVAIYYDNSKVMTKYKIPILLKKLIIKILTQISPRWMYLNPKVKKVSSTDFGLERFYNNIDFVIATGAGTVDVALELFKNSKKYYFIQDFEADQNKESWDIFEEQLFKTYDSGLINITVSKWLKDIVDQHSTKESTYIRNPISLESYRVKTPIEDRDRNKIGMLYHNSPRKGCKYTLLALEKVKKDFPNIKVVMFGACPPPESLPDWITYYENATQEQTIDIYNSISIFVSGPIKEGFGLTGLEAMACGAALISSNNLGAMEYAENNRNSLLSSIKDVNGMKKNIEELLMDDRKRIKLAKQGVETAKGYSWDKAYSKFKKVLLG